MKICLKILECDVRITLGNCHGRTASRAACPPPAVCSCPGHIPSLGFSFSASHRHLEIPIFLQ